MWELPDAPFQGTGMNSRNHHMYSSVGYYLLRVAGLSLAPGTRELTATVGTSLSHASATLHTAHGDVSFTWSWGDRLDVDLKVPVGMRALLYMPCEAGLPHIDGQRVSLAEDVEVLEAVKVHGSRFNVFNMSSGRYRLFANSKALVV